jgi:putative ATPase
MRVTGYPGRVRVDTLAAVISVVEGDLTVQEVDAIVNAANEHLMHGGGVAAAIVSAGGPQIQAESDRWVDANGPLTPGRAAVTGAGAMVSRWVIHVAGPRFREDQDNESLLAIAVTAALDAAEGVGARSVAMPAISAGIFGYPLADACRVIVEACQDWDTVHAGALDEIRLVGRDGEAAATFRAVLG